MNSKTITIAILLLIVGLVYLADAKGWTKETIKSSGKPKALKSQGLLMAALGFISIF